MLIESGANAIKQHELDAILARDVMWFGNPHSSSCRIERHMCGRAKNVRLHLRPLEAVTEIVKAEPAPSGVPLNELRQLAFAAAREPARSPSASRKNIYQRSRDVRAYVLARASGKCEGCGTSAPFLRVDGTPYLEPHHLRRSPVRTPSRHALASQHFWIGSKVTECVR